MSREHLRINIEVRSLALSSLPPLRSTVHHLNEPVCEKGWLALTIISFIKTIQNIPTSVSPSREACQGEGATCRSGSSAWSPPARAPAIVFAPSAAIIWSSLSLFFPLRSSCLSSLTVAALIFTIITFTILIITWVLSCFWPSYFCLASESSASWLPACCHHGRSWSKDEKGGAGWWWHQSQFCVFQPVIITITINEALHCDGLVVVVGLGTR